MQAGLCMGETLDAKDIENRIARAEELHALNFNCAQCVAVVCCDIVGIDEATAFRMLEGFGGGMGNNTQTCGALSGAVAIVSYALSEGPQNPTTKKATYKRIGPLVDEFKMRAGSTICREIKGLDGGPALHSCPNCIADGIRLAIQELSQ